VTNRIVGALEHAATKLGKTLGEDAGKAVGDLYHSTGHNLKGIAADTTAADLKHETALRNLMHDSAQPPVHAPHEVGGPAHLPHQGGHEPPLGGEHAPGQPSEGNTGCTTGGDPVDVVSGQMITSATDIELPGLLPLVLGRAYASGYTGGRWFGPGWASTLDQRVQIDEHGIHYAGQDAEIQHYPLPTGQSQVLPARGPQRPLTWDRDSDTLLVQDTVTGWTQHFAAPPHPGAPTRAITALTDRNGHRIDYLPGPDGLPVEVRHSGGYRVAVDTALTPAGPRITGLRLLHDGTGTRVLDYAYDDRGRLTGITDSTGLPLTYTYDDQDRITSWTDRNTHWYAYEYGPDGRVTRGHGPQGALEAHFAYDTGARVTTVTDSLGARTAYHYDRHGHISKVVDPLGGTVHTAYDRHGRLLAHTDEFGRTTRYTLDYHGEIVRVDHPDGSHMAVVYNGLSLPVEIVSPDGSVWHQSYDPAGNRVELTDPTGAVTRFGYDGAGHLSSVTDGLGSRTQVRTDTAGLVIEVVDPLGGWTTYRRDAFGRPISATDPLGNSTSHTWTVEGRLLSLTTADGATETWTYDAEGNTLTHTDQAGARTEMEYTHFGTMAARTGPDGARYTFTHDSELRLVRVTGPHRLSWTYVHDQVGRVTAETDFNGCTSTFDYDAAGQVVRRTNSAGQTVTFGYDVMGNLISKAADGHTSTLDYDPAGRLVRASAPGVELSRRYDPLGRLLTETVNGRSLHVAYDPLGRRTGRRTPSGAETTWTYDPAGGVSSLTASGHVVAFERDAAGRETSRRLGSGLALASAWDVVDRLIVQGLTHESAKGFLQHRTYAYRSDGAVTTVTDQSTGTRRFDMDRLGRVTAVRADGWTETYAYDTVGNLAEAHWPTRRDEAARGERTYSGTLIRTAGRIRYEHDRHGRVVARRETTLSGRTATWRYSWDAEDRLVAVTTPDGERWTYTYDPFGRRTAKQHLSSDGTHVTEWTDFVWDGPDLAEQTAHSPHLPGPYSLTWDRQGYHPIAQSERIALPDSEQDAVDRRFFAIITDLVGAPTHLINPDGTTAWEARTTLWGKATESRRGTTSTPLRFPGQYYDSETKLHYNHHRYYDPATARYLTPDPLGLAPAPNPYAYVDNPQVWIDPFGLSADYNRQRRNHPKH
jgi:RHS repeat-associated protein